MDSGIAVSDEVKAIIKKISSTSGRGARGAIFRVSDDHKFVVKSETMDVFQDSQENVFEKVVEHLKSNQSCFAFMDVHMVDVENKQKDKLVLITWAPDSAPVKQKMLATTTSNALKKECGDSFLYLQLNGEEQKCVDAIVAKLAEANKSPIVEFERRKVAFDKQKNTYDYAD